MFDKDFYPTPVSVIFKMLEPYNDLASRIILEPSAGKGDIADRIKSSGWNSSYKNLYCIEKSPELQAILKDKGHKVVDSDFLRHNPEIDYDLIVMNPPFSDGDSHLLKAWQILRGGDIVCLLNAETIDNPCTKERELLKRIIEQNGSIEYLGDCFRFAERKTAVNVAMVRLHKDKTENFDFGFYEKVKEEAEKDHEETGLASRDILDNIIINYQLAVKHYRLSLEARSQAKANAKALGIEYLGNFFDKIDFSEFLAELKRRTWGEIAKLMRVEKYMTSGVRKNFSAYIVKYADMGITKRNILEFVNFLFNNRESIIEQGIGEVFDQFTAYHEENRAHVEGWKTNDRWKVTNKVILPYCIEWDQWHNKFRQRYGGRIDLDDIDRVMAYISGVDFDKVEDTISNKLRDAEAGELTDSRFFKFRAFKKETIHLIFKDEWLYREFNMRACALKNWLPEADKRAWQKAQGLRVWQ